MDKVDELQQKELDDNKLLDAMQQSQIDKQGFLVKVLLVINTAAALAQIAECIKIYRSFHG